MGDGVKLRHRGLWGVWRRREGGAALVETALILPIVLILFMGVFDFGTAIADLNSLRQGNREAVRRAVVADVGVPSCPIIGGAPTPDTAALVCLTKSKTGLDEAAVTVKVVLDSNYVEGDALIVCAQYPLHSRTGFFAPLLDDKMAHSQVDMRIEKATLNIEAFAEGGGDWSWCG
jgi:hypothetical protein